MHSKFYFQLISGKFSVHVQMKILDQLLLFMKLFSSIQQFYVTDNKLSERLQFNYEHFALSIDSRIRPWSNRPTYPVENYQLVQAWLRWVVITYSAARQRRGGYQSMSYCIPVITGMEVKRRGVEEALRHLNVLF